MGAAYSGSACVTGNLRRQCPECGPGRCQCEKPLKFPPLKDRPAAYERDNRCDRYDRQAMREANSGCLAA